MEQYKGESKKCKISYEGMEIEFGYTVMHNLCNSIDIKMEYFRDVAEVAKYMQKIRNQMGLDAQKEFEEI
jgi:hypothetical protein